MSVDLFDGVQQKDYFCPIPSESLIIVDGEIDNSNVKRTPFEYSHLD